MKRTLALLAALVLFALVLGGGALWWVANTEAGLRWALARAQAFTDGRLAVAGVGGTLAREASVERLHYAADAWRIEVRALRLRPDLSAVWEWRLAVDTLEAGQVTLTLATDNAPDAPRDPLPADISPPIAVHLAEAAVAAFELRTGENRHRFEALTFGYEADADAHRLRTLHADSPFGRLTADGTVGAAAPFALDVAVALADTRTAAAQRLSLHLDGSLEHTEAYAQAAWADMRAQAEAVLRPLAQLVPETLELRAARIDLAAIVPGTPYTEFGIALSAARTADGRLAGRLVVENTLDGPVDLERLPIGSFAAAFRVDPAQLGNGALQARLDALRVEFGPGGLAVGEGELDSEGVRLRLAVADLDLRALHSQLRATRLDGPVELALASERQWLRIDLAGAEAGLAADATRVGERVTLTARAHLGDNRLTLDGAVGAPDDALAWQLKAPRLDQVHDAVAGRANASGTLSGDFARLHFDLEAGDLRLPGVLALDALSGSGQVGRAEQAPLELDLTARALALPGLELERLTVDTGGTLARHDAALHARGVGVDVAARLRGGWDGAAWKGELRALRERGEYGLRLVAPAALEIAPDRFALAGLRLAFPGGRLVVPQASGEAGRLAATGEFAGLPARWLLAAAGRDEALASTLRLDGRWTLAATPRLDGELSIRRARGDLAPTALSEPIGLRHALLAARFSDGHVAAKLEVDARIASLRASGTLAPAAGAPGTGYRPSSPVTLDAQLQVDELAALLAPLQARARVAGRGAAELRASGTLVEPRLTGSLRGDGLGLDVPPYGIYLDGGHLRAAFDDDILHITDFAITAVDGHFEATGVLPLRPGAEGARLVWGAHALRLLNRPDMRLVLSGEGELRVNERRVGLSGRLRADEGFFHLDQERLPRLGEDVVLVGEEPDPGNGADPPLALDLSLDLGDRLSVSGFGLAGRLAGDVRLFTDPRGELRAEAQVHTVHASFYGYGQDLDVEPGLLVFDGPIDDPALEIVAWRRGLPVEAGVRITGTARMPLVELLSEPDMPEGEKLSWLVLGRAQGDATPADLSLLQTAAAVLLTRPGGAPPAHRRLAGALGLHEIAVRGEGELAAHVVTLGRRFSDRLYVSFERGLGPLAEYLVTLDFTLTDRVSLRVEAGAASGAGFFFGHSWN